MRFSPTSFTGHGLSLGAMAVAMLLASCTTPPAAPRAALLQAEVQSVGRTLHTADGWQSTWPAVMWRTAFSGRSIGIDTQDRAGYHVEIDGAVEAPIPATPARVTTWYRELHSGAHTIEVIRMGPTPRAPGTLFGFVLAEHGHWLPVSPPPKRQILFIADSIATGYGDLSPSQQCPDDVLPLTDASQSFPVLAARALRADWQLDAMNGIGLVRNWQGIWRGTNYGTYAMRTLQSDPASIYSDPYWHPQVAVVSIGANDLATPLAAGEPWTDASLRAAVAAANDQLLSSLRKEVGPGALIIVMIDLTMSNPMNEIAMAQVNKRRAAGDQRIDILPYPEMERTGCNWHPSLAAHRAVGKLLAEFIQEHQGF